MQNRDCTSTEWLSTFITIDDGFVLVELDTARRAPIINAILENRYWKWTTIITQLGYGNGASATSTENTCVYIDSSIWAIYVWIRRIILFCICTHKYSSIYQILYMNRLLWPLCGVRVRAREKERSSNTRIIWMCDIECFGASEAGTCTHTLE